MKKAICFLIAITASIIMCIWANYFFAADRIISVLQAGTGFIFLQGILIIKYTVGTLLVMPRKVAFKPIVYGFIAADITMAASAVVWNVIFPVHILVVQVIILLFYADLKKPGLVKQKDTLLLNIKNSIMVESI